MTKWEYKYEVYDGIHDISDMIKINKLGKEGWELVNFFVKYEDIRYSEMIFKRPLK